MSGLSGSPRLVKGGIVLIDPGSGAIRRVIVLQYNAESLNRTLQVQGTGGEGGDRTEALRLTGPAVETIKLEAELDATDQLEFPDRNPDAVDLGIHPQLAALETTIHPSAAALTFADLLASIGFIEIAPMQSHLAIFVWSRQRILPVRITEFSVVEDAFDPALNPMRAKVSIGMRVLSVDDLGFGHRGGALFMASLLAKERLVTKAPSRTVGALGIRGIS
jgi:hypothetical protein